jgi:hypothetical protein
LYLVTKVARVKDLAKRPLEEKHDSPWAVVGVHDSDRYGGARVAFPDLFAIVSLGDGVWVVLDAVARAITNQMGLVWAYNN